MPPPLTPPYLFLAWQANTGGLRHYRANTLNGLLTQLAAALQVTDATGAVVDFQRTHRMRHTKATDLLNAGVAAARGAALYGSPVTGNDHALRQDLAETHEAEFLRFAKLGRDARPLEMDPADVYELVQLDRHTDRILPNGVCLLPPAKRCDRGNACLTCDHFATDARHLEELRAQLAATEELIQARQTQHRQRTGAEMGPDHIWLTERNTELASLRAIIAALGTGSCGDAVRGAGVPAQGRPAGARHDQPQARRPRRCQLSRTRSQRCARPRPPNAMPLLHAPKPGYARSPRPASPSPSAQSPPQAACRWTSSTATPTCVHALNGSAATSPHLRHAPPGEPGSPPASSVVATLTARPTDLRRELAETKAQLAAAHGELLTLRRHPGNAAPGD